MIRVGSRVSALVGEHGHTEFNKNRKERKRYEEKLHSTVVESKLDRNWVGHRDQRSVVSEEEYSTFKLKYEGPGSDLQPTNQEAAAARQQQQETQQGVTTLGPINRVQQEGAGTTAGVQE